MSDTVSRQTTLPALNSAVEALRQGGVVAYPTEAVFGLGCNPYDDAALQRIINIKGRDAHKGFILIASSQLQLSEFITPLTNEQQLKLDEHWPGPVTFVIPANDKIGGSLLAGYRDSVAVRVSSHPVVVALCEQYGGAIVSTSANRSGEPALRLASEVTESMGTELDAIVDAHVGQLDSPTKIFELASGKQLR